MAKDIIETLNNRMPKLINISDEIYESLFGKADFIPNTPITKSDDYQCGAICNELEYLRGYINRISATTNIDDMTGTLLNTVIEFFTHLERIWDETDANLLNRFHALIRRNANPRWMTIWSMIDAFSYFFDKDDIYAIENYVETNLLLNGGFEEGSGNVFTNWTKSESGSSVIVEAIDGDEFVEDRAAEYQVVSDSLISLSQTKNTVAQGHYKLDLFYWDDGNSSSDNVIAMRVRRSSDSYYWDFAGNWQSGDIYKLVSKKGISKYTYWCEYVYQENGTPENLTISITRGGAGTYKFRVDEVNFGIWQDYPSFKLLVVVDVEAGAKDLVLWNGSGEDNLIDRGECESATSPMIMDETVPYEPTPANQTWSRDATDPYMASYNWRLNKDTTIGNGDAETFLTDNKNTTDMHGLVAGEKYTLAFIGKPDEITNVHKVIIHEYYSAAWHETAILTDTAGSWKRYSETITLNAGTTGFAISVFINTDAAQDAKLDIDNIRLIEGDDSDIEEAGFFDNNFMLGTGGGYSSSLYNFLLDLIKPEGVKAIISIVSA